MRVLMQNFPYTASKLSQLKTSIFVRQFAVYKMLIVRLQMQTVFP